jgi:tRNA (mo5U34)-methyltransferase
MNLGDGLVTKGDSPSSEIIASAMPDLRGKSVLDIGAWDGKYSYEAEAAGASRIVALDHYVWRLDPAARQKYYDECQAEGMLPDPDKIDRGFLIDGLPGRSGFDLVHRYLDSNVEPVVDDFMTMDIDQLGQFDVVLYFGVLYHMVNPIEGLKRLRRVTKELAIIETAGTFVPGYQNCSLIDFFAGDELHADYGNWFAPSEVALQGMGRVAGFRRVEIKARTEIAKPLRFRARDRDQRPVHCRMVAHAYV